MKSKKVVEAFYLEKLEELESHQSKGKAKLEQEIVEASDGKFMDPQLAPEMLPSRYMAAVRVRKAALAYMALISDQVYALTWFLDKDRTEEDVREKIKSAYREISFEMDRDIHESAVALAKKTRRPERDPRQATLNAFEGFNNRLKPEVDRIKKVENHIGIWKWIVEDEK